MFQVQYKLKMYSPSGHDVDVFVFSSNRFGDLDLALYLLLTNGSFALNGCRWNESSNC